MALLRSSYQTDVYLAELQDQGKRLSAPRRFTLDDRSDFPSAWTADSQTVLFASDRDGRSHIFKQPINETQPELLVGGNDDLGAPRLTPDGLSVLYLIWPLDPSANRRLMRISLAGGPSQFILEGAGIFDPQCARLPSTICIYGQVEPRSEDFRFFTFDPAGTKRTEIVAARIKKEDADSKTWWSVSPDGRYLVNSRSQNPYRYKDAAVRIVNLVDGTQRYITVPGAGLLQGMAWAVDSKSVWVGAYIDRSARGTHSGVFNVALTGNVNVAFKGTLTTLLPVPSPDGRRLALWALTRSSNMWLLENF
jgi:Tol biopolymer transport system component